MHKFQSKPFPLCEDEGSRSALHGGRELEVRDANVVIAAVEEDVGLRERGADGREVTVRGGSTIRTPKYM